MNRKMVLKISKNLKNSKSLLMKLQKTLNKKKN